MTGWQALERKAQLRARAGLARRLQPRPPDDQVTDLAGNDYLGLSRHPEVVAATAAALAGYGLGATGSRLVRGATEEHAALERELADWLGAEQALVYSSGYLANLGAVAALAGPRTLVVADAHNHASLVDGCRLAGGQTEVTPHADLAAVAKALRAADGRRDVVVVTESVFSVDGDLAPLPALHRLARRHQAVLLVDDAHGLGVVGPAGAGGAFAAGLAGEPDVVVTATLSKALGAAGGVVAGPAAMIRHLVDTGRTFIYDTALPPAVAAGARAAVRLARAADDLRAELRERAAAAVRRLAAAGLSVSPAPTGAADGSGDRVAPARAGAAAGAADGVASDTGADGVAGGVVPAGGVISVAAPDAAAAASWAAACRRRGVAVGCFRPPSTPDGRSRLRLTVNVGVPRAELDAALAVVVETAP